jgi:RNA polymerase sigma-70 factor (ECF subfamily)
MQDGPGWEPVSAAVRHAAARALTKTRTKPLLETTPLSQADLILRCHQGDQAACRELVALYKRPVYLLALRWTGNMEDAEDIAQETFLRALTHLDAFDQEREIRVWLLTIAANLCRNHKRARWRRWQAMLALFERKQRGGSRRDPLLRDQLQRGLDSLAPDLRATVILVWIQGLTHREAAEALGVSEGTISWRVFKAKEKMRKWLGADPLAAAGRKDGWHDDEVQ